MWMQVKQSPNTAGVQGQKFDMLLWMSGFQNPLIHTDFDMFVDE